MPETVMTPRPDFKAAADSEAALLIRATLQLLEKWSVDQAAGCRLLGADSPAYQAWAEGRATDAPADVLSRATDLLAIHQALRALFKEPQRAYEWVRRPNRTFEGRSALEEMIAESQAGIARVRSYLEAEFFG